MTGRRAGVTTISRSMPLAFSGAYASDASIRRKQASRQIRKVVETIRAAVGPEMDSCSGCGLPFGAAVGLVNGEGQ